LEDNKKLRKVIEKARTDWKSNKGKKQHASAKPAAVPPQQKKQGPKPTIKRLLRLMKHDYIPEGGEEYDQVAELITELGDLSGIQDGEWPHIDRFEDPRLLGALLDAGLNPEITDKKGGSLLRQCVGHPECIDLLVEQGVDIDRRSGRDDETALMRATYVGDEECVERLLEAGANPSLEFSPFAKVMLDMNEEMIEIIEAAREDWNRNQGKRKKVKKATAKKK
jgi:ankyrin repeat protein